MGENSDVFLGKFGKKTQTPVYFGLWWWTISEHPSDIDVPMGAPRSPAVSGNISQKILGAMFKC